jgi:MFS family permease
MSTVDAFAAIRLPVVRNFAFARLMNFGGMVILSISIGWELYERTGSALSLGLVGAFELTPVLLLMVFAGNAADRYPRRNIVVVAQAVLILTALGFAYLSATKGPVSAFYLLLLLVGSVRAFSSPAFMTILPQLISKEHFANANAWTASAGQLAAVGGPAVGGLIIAMAGGAKWAFVTVAFTQLCVMVAFARLPAIAPVPQDPANRRSPAQVFAGFKFIKRNPLFLAAITLDLFAWLLGGVVALLPIYAKDILHVGAEGLGWLRAAPAVGSLAMALLVTRAPPFKRPGWIMLMAFLGFGVATIGFGVSRNMGLSLVCLCLTGAFDTISVVVRSTLEQVITPDHLRGRVSAVNYVFIGLSNEMGMFRAGAMAALIGPVLAVVFGGVATLVVVGAVMGIWPVLARVGPLHTLKPLEEFEALTEREEATAV